MALRLSGQIKFLYYFGSVRFVSKSPLRIEYKQKLTHLQFCPKSLGAMLEY